MVQTWRAAIGVGENTGVMLRALLAILLIGALAVGLLTLVPLMRELPPAGPVKGDLMELTRARRGEWVPLAQVPQVVQEAVIATEDARFYEHRGLDVLGAVRATVANLRAGRPVQGGSTISQQLAKLYLEREDRTLERKLLVIGMAAKLELRYSKADILEMYLNSVYFGPYAYGIGSAARVYFRKPASELNLAEATVLAGLPQAPSLYDPIHRLDRVKARQAVVIAAMARAGYLSADEASAVRGARTALDP
jgi:penicillin-binding protein 1A